MQDDIDFLKTRYNLARNKYKPSEVTTLLIAESPPCNPERFFYFEDVRTHDSLFLEIMGVIYPELKAAYLKSKRDPELKAELLETFQADGYLLIDLSEVPQELSGQSDDACLPNLLARVNKLATAKTRVVLIKANVYDCAYPALKEAGYNVSAERLPFPGSGQQLVFRKGFRRALGMGENKSDKG
jgi:hypothetical protein